MIKKIISSLRGEPQLDKLKEVGLKIGVDFNFGKQCFFDPSHCFLIEIGNNVTFSTRVHLLAHDASTKKLIGYTKIGRLTINDYVFIGANTTILPGVTIGEKSIIGAGSVVTKDIQAGMVACGNPARVICSVEDYINKYKNIDKKFWFEEEYTLRGKITEDMKSEMKDKLANGGIGFVR